MFNAADPHLVGKFVAFALIGGYAGHSLLVSPAKQYLDKFNEIDEKQKATDARQLLLERKQRAANEAANTAVRLAEKLLRGLPLTADESASFPRALEAAPSATRYDIALRAGYNRRQNWRTDKEHMGRSIQIFQALVETRQPETPHWWYASLAYCLKDQTEPNYVEAAKLLTKAIEVRDSELSRGMLKKKERRCSP
jgi:hypothetical protein